ncbi:microtubule-associated protein tau [Xylocopa sonorina]|uniref:microtubule-associated protein tau n=1 Tax=Xylocopa sonorina TaxID=1818115 RepID=UPI00403B1950
MDSQQARSDAAESSSNREPIAVKPNPQLQPVFRARPQGPPGLPRYPVNNGPIGQPRPRGQLPIRFENRSPVGVANSGQFVQLRPYGPPRPPGGPYPQKPSPQGQHPPIVLNPRFPQSTVQRPGPQQGPRPPQSGNFQRFQGILQRPQQPQQQQQQAAPQQGRHPDILARSQEVLQRHFQRNESLLNVSQQSSPAKRDDRKPAAPRVISEKMAHVEGAKGVQQLENAVSKEKVREIAENDDDDDVVMDGKSPRLNGDARKQEDLIDSKLSRRESVESMKRPDTATKRDDPIECKLAKSEPVESIRRPDTATKRDDSVESKSLRKDSAESIKRSDSGTKQGDSIDPKLSKNGNADSTERPDTGTKQDDSIESKSSKNGSADSTKRPDTATKDDSIESKSSKNGSADSTKRPDTATKDDSIERKSSTNGSAESTKRPDTATKKQDELVEPKLSTKEDTESKRPGTATINGKIEKKPDIAVEKTDSKVSEVTSDLDSKKSNDINVMESDNRLASTKSAEETRKEPLDKQEMTKVGAQLEEPAKPLAKDEIATEKKDSSKETMISTVAPTVSAIAEKKIETLDRTSVSALPEELARPESAKRNGHELDMSSISPVKTTVTIPTTTLSDGTSQQLQIPSKSAGQSRTTPSTEKHPEQSKDESKAAETPAKPSPPLEVNSNQKPEPTSEPSKQLDNLAPTKEESEQESKKPSTPPSKSLEGTPTEVKQTEEETKRDEEKREVKSVPVSDSKSDIDSSIEAMEGSDKSCVSTPLGTNQSQSQTETNESSKTSEKSSKEASLDLDGSRDEKESKDLPAKSSEATADEPKVQKISKDSHVDELTRDSLETNKVDLPGSMVASEKEASETKKSAVSVESQGKVPETVLSPPEPSDDGVAGFDDGQPRSLKSTPSESPRLAVSPKSPKSPVEEEKLEEEDKVTDDGKNLTDQQKSDEKSAAISKALRSATPKGQRAQTPVKQDEKLGKKSPVTPEIQNGGVTNETVQSNAEPTTNGVADLATKKSPSKAIEADKRSTAGSPVKSPSKSVKSLPRTPETPSSTVGQEKKKLPMNKVQVGSAPSPNLKTVRSKIGSLENASYKPGGGKVKIENRKLDFSKAQPKIAAKNEKYTPSGGDKKIAQVKLQWNAKPKVGSLENATYKPGGGDKKIETVKLDFKDKAKPKVGSKDNAKHIPGGGSVKSLATPPKTPQDTNNEIQTQKIDIKAESKIGSLDNVKHKPGGGDKKIFNDKDYLRQTGSNVESLSGSLSGSLSPVPPGTVTAGKNGLPTSDENLNQEC